MKRKIRLLSGATAFLLACAMLCSCSAEKQDESWRDAGYDLSLPQLGQDGWYLVFEDNFVGDELNEDITFGENYTGNREIWTT